MNKAPVTSKKIVYDKTYMKLEHEKIRGKQ